MWCTNSREKYDISKNIYMLIKYTPFLKYAQRSAYIDPQTHADRYIHSNIVCGKKKRSLSTQLPSLG